MSIKRLTQLSLLIAVALIIFVIEMHIPNLVPIPGVKLGLANIVTVYAIYRFTLKETLLVVIARILLGSIFGGNVSVIIYSLSGALCCLGGMLILRHIVDKKYIWLSSVIGAVLHNIGQVAAAIFMMKTTAVLSYLPFLLVSGCIAGAFTGICAQILIGRIKLD